MMNDSWIGRFAGRFDETYFERGKEAGVSWYEHYRWMPERSQQEALAFVRTMGIVAGASVVDFGCAKGFFVRAMVEGGFDAWGIDISRYALDHCDPTVKNRLSRPKDSIRTYDAGFVKDTLEHVAYEDLDGVLEYMKGICRRWLVIVPIAKLGTYVCREYESDATHIIREPAEWWLNKLAKYWEAVFFTSRIDGLKDNWASVYPQGNLFVVTA